MVFNSGSGPLPGPGDGRVRTAIDDKRIGRQLAARGPRGLDTFSGESKRDDAPSPRFAQQSVAKRRVLEGSDGAGLDQVVVT